MTVELVPDAPLERLDLGAGAWVDVIRGWIRGGDELHDALLQNVAWQPSRLYRYDHYVDERRLGARWRVGEPPPHPVLLDAHRRLQHAYGVRFDGCGLIRYRDGEDGQGFHRDRELRWLEDTIIAVLSLGARRPWLLRRRVRPRERGRPGATGGLGRAAAGDRRDLYDLAPGSGDLLVMGGRCQTTWEHSVAYQRGQRVGDRVSLQWRWTSRRGRPEVGPNYRAPRFYARH